MSGRSVYDIQTRAEGECLYTPISKNSAYKRMWLLLVAQVIIELILHYKQDRQVVNARNVFKISICEQLVAMHVLPKPVECDFQ